jgi:hypothetical protein
MSHITQTLLRKYLSNKEIAELAFKGGHEFNPFLKLTAPIFNLDELLVDMVGFPILHRQGYSPRSIYEATEEAREIAEEKGLRYYNQVKGFLNNSQKRLAQRLHALPNKSGLQKARIEELTDQETLRVLKECFEKDIPEYADEETARTLRHMGIHDYIDTSFLPTYGHPKSFRDAYLKKIQSRLKKYDIGTADVSKLVLPGKQLRLSF